MQQFTMRCVNRVNTEQTPDHVVVGFAPQDSKMANNVSLVLPVEEFPNYKPGRTYTFTVEEAPEPAAPAASVPPADAAPNTPPIE